MHTVMRGVVGVALVAGLAVAVAGCARTTDSDPTVSPIPTSTSPSPTATTPAVDFGTPPRQDGVPTCPTLLPADLVHALVPAAEPVDALRDTPDIAGAWAFATTAGGADCESANGVSAIDEVLPGTRDDPTYQGVRIAVLPDAAADFADAGARATSPDSSATTVQCRASDSARVYCGGGVLAGDAWVDLRSVRLQDASDATPETAEPAFQALLDAAARTVEDSPLGSARPEHGEPDGSFTTCDADNVAAVASERLDDPNALGSDSPPGIQQYAMNRLGAAGCLFQAQGSGPMPYPVTGAVYSALPGGAWVVRERLDAGTIDRADRVELDGLPEDTAAWRTCTDLACSVDVVSDGDWTHFLLFERVAPDTSSAVVRWAEAALAD